MTEWKRKSLSTEICCKNNLKIWESTILLLNKLEISFLGKVHIKKLFKNRFDSDAGKHFIQYFFLSSAVCLNSKMKHTTQLVIYLGIFLLGFFTQQGTIRIQSVLNQETCFLQCNASQPLAAIENSYTVNLIPTPKDQGNHLRKAFSNKIEVLLLKHSYKGRIQKLLSYFFGKSISIFEVINASPALIKVFRCWKSLWSNYFKNYLFNY